MIRFLSLFLALCFAPFAALGQQAPRNPLVQTQPPAASKPTNSEEPQDYRKNADPSRQREGRKPETALPNFGYSFFEPSRRAIEARREHVRRIAISGPAEIEAKRALEEKPEAELTVADQEAVAGLTAAQKLDLLERHRDGKLTDEERTRYRALFEPRRPPGEGRDSATRTERESRDTEAGRGSRSRFDKESEQDTRPTPASAFHEVTDPLTAMYRNVAATVPADYQLAPGDTVTLRYWSPTMAARELALPIGPTGAINIPEMGRLIVRGQTAAQAEAMLRERMRRLYRDADVSLTLQELRTIPVTLSGESFAPGPYTVPAVATAIGLLIGTGGPTENGSLRRIQVLRGGRPAATLDFYAFLIRGDRTGDLTLRAGDVIYIPPAGDRVQVRGEVRRPAVYELAAGEGLHQALEFAGGIRPTGVDQRVQVSTVQPGAARVLRDVDLRGPVSGQKVEVFDGDSIEVFSVRPTLVNKVTVEGAVDQPGEYAIVDGMTVADLVERARNLTSEAYPGEAHLYRWNPDNTLALVQISLEKALARDPAANLKLERWDRLVIYTREEIAWTGRREATVRGAVRRPGIYYRGDNMRVKDLLMLAGGTTPEAHMPQAVLQHQKPDGTFGLRFVNLQQALKGDPEHNVAIEDRDILAVYRADEARFTPERVVTLAGEVVSPGTYARSEGMRLSDLLKIAGGVKPAAGDRIVVARARTTRDAEPLTAVYTPSSPAPNPDIALEDGDTVTVQGRGDYMERPYLIRVTGAVNRPGPVTVRGSNVRLSDVIQLAGGLKKEAYPEGAEFFRKPELLATAGQKQLAVVISALNDQLNQLQHGRELAAADIARIKAIGSATQPQIPVAVPGIPNGTNGGPNPAAAAGTASLFQHSLVSPPRVLKESDLEPRGNVAVNLPAALRKPQSDDDILMLDGDELTIPERPTTVLVMGAVIRSSAVLYQPGARADHYISQAGGLAADARREGIVVIRLGGGLSPLSKVRSIQPGDVIVVPTKVLAEKIGSRSNDFDSFFRSLTSSALIFFGIRKLFGF